MNKTVNINLAGISFHIDEDAFLKLKNYLEAIKNSLTGEAGREEILQDIEARIAELFSKNMQNQNQVISMLEVNRVIEIMGQPEDYALDDNEETERENTSKEKKLYRDPDDTKIAGVCSGIGHYITIDALWIRILFIILSLATSGTFIIVYILLWALVPEAKTTVEKLEMRGEPINLSNIERKVREGFDTMAGKVKDVDYKKYGEKVNKTASEFSGGVGNAASTFLGVVGKLIGIFLIIIAVSGLLSLVFALISVTFLGIFEPFWLDYIETAQIGIPLWGISLLVFISSAIPLLFLLMLGLKLTSKHLRTLNLTGAILLLVVWLTANFILAFFVIKQITERSFEEQVVIREQIPIGANDTLYLKMQANSAHGNTINQDRDFVLKTAPDGNKIIYSENIDISIVKSSNYSTKLEIIKESEGRNYEEAYQRANTIDFESHFEKDTLTLNGYFTTDAKNGFYDQEIDVILYLPKNSSLQTDAFLEDYLKESKSIFTNYAGANYYTIQQNQAVCAGCEGYQAEKEGLNTKNDTLSIEKDSLQFRKDTLEME